jgi:hypothetical protein
MSLLCRPPSLVGDNVACGSMITSNELNKMFQCLNVNANFKYLKRNGVGCFELKMHG